VSGTINSELGNYTNTVDLNAQLGIYSTTSGIIEKPGGYADNNLESYIQSKAISGGFNFESQWIKIRSQNIPDQADMEYPFIVPEGTYNAVEILEILKNIIGGFMYAMFTEYGYAEKKNERKYNLDRFNPDFIVGKQDDLSFEIDLTDGPTIMEMFNLPSLMSSVSTNISGGEMRVYFDYDLTILKPEYDNFEDRTVRNLLRVQSDFISKPSDFTVDLPTYLD